jgi:hypothetical protein
MSEMVKMDDDVTKANKRSYKYTSLIIAPKWANKALGSKRRYKTRLLMNLNLFS